MSSNTRKIFDLFSTHERKRGIQLLCLMTFVAMFETFGVASIFPFMAVLANPGVIETNPYLSAAFHRMGFQSTQNFLNFLGVVFFCFVTFDIALKAFVSYARALFTEMVGFSLSRRLVAGYLSQPYAWFLNQHSANIGKTVLSEVDAVISSSLRPMMEVFAKGVITLGLITLVLWVDPLIALSAGLGLGGSYGLIYSAIRRKLQKLGKERVVANRDRFTAVAETFGGIKDIKVAGLEGGAVERFKGPARRFAKTRASAAIISQLPPMALEAIIMGGFVLMMLFYLRDMQKLESMLPKLALYGFAIFRLKPAMQSLFTNFVTLRFSSPALDSLHQSLDSLQRDTRQTLSRTPPQAMGIREGLSLDSVRYDYPGAVRPAVYDVSLKIPVCATVGLVGSTGSGKTTLVDIILGLLIPEKGTLHVDGKLISPDNVRNWQRSIGYVPQNIYLADTTVSANIAFGLDSKQIDIKAVELAARIANLHDFVSKEMPNGYETVIGERGVRLSGGQRQRIGIARALYHDPDVLILDEATSALDNLTEKAVMDAVNTLSHKKTIILIAHRLTTVQNCDCIYMLEKGKIVHSGTYDQLFENCEDFRRLASK